MTLISKPLENIDESDLQGLVESQVAEGKTIEYKATLPGNTDSEKKEFLADVSSFANASGGNVIYGIRAERGVPTQVCGLGDINADAEILRLENMLRQGIEPRIPGLSVRKLPLQTAGVAIIIRISRSWVSPHMVTFGKHLKFYSRNSAGKYPLDVSELREAFVLSETTAERIRNFRVERVGKVLAEETPVALETAAKIVLHIVPFGAFDPSARFDVASLARDTSRLQPMYASSWSGRHNFDGFLTFSRFPDHPSAHSYLQVFRNGATEAVEAYLLRDRDGKRIIPSVAFEEKLLEKLPTYLSVQRELGVEPPLFIMVSLLGVSGYTMGVDRARFMFDEAYPIDRDALLVPEIMIETFDCDVTEVMRPAFDAIWNATGWPRSMNYDEKGKWTGQH